MTEPKNKTETLSETTKTYLIEVFIREVYKRKKDITNKYVQKGLGVEEDAITLLSLIDGVYYQKNETHYQNDFIIGTPDIVLTDSVKDIKSSWDIFTFFASKFAAVNKMYYWQMQGYMWLTDTKYAQLHYCLIDTPETLINDAKRRFLWNAGLLAENELSEKAFTEIDRNMTYSDIPRIERMHTIDIARNDADIERLQQRIIECREYITKTF